MMRLFLALLLGFSGPALAETPTIEDLLNATDDAQRGASSQGVMSMHVKTSHHKLTPIRGSKFEDHRVSN